MYLMLDPVSSYLMLFWFLIPVFSFQNFIWSLSLIFRNGTVLLGLAPLFLCLPGGTLLGVQTFQFFLKNFLIWTPFIKIFIECLTISLLVVNVLISGLEACEILVLDQDWTQYPCIEGKILTIADHQGPESFLLKKLFKNYKNIFFPLSRTSVVLTF